MDRPSPSLFLLVPGPWAAVEELTRALEEHGVDAKADDESPMNSGDVRVRLVEDDHFDEAFSWGRIRRTLA